MSGRRLADRYELEEVLARGGMGVVWRGRDLRLDRAVAVKLVSGPAAADPTMVERFAREARAAALLNHPNIVGIHDFGTDGDDSYLVMELVEGRSLAAVLADGPLPVADAVEVTAQACAGLAAAHDAGIVHRDVKPANLIRTPAGVVKVCDFGVAHLAHAERLTSSAIAMGSTSYMAPEQVNGEPVDARTDLYGLGCTLYALLAGAPPFVGATPLAVVHQHVTTPPPDLLRARPDVPPALATLVADLLAKRPEDRPGSARVVGARLAALPVAAPRRRRLVWGLVAAGAAAVAGVVLVSLLASAGDGVPGTVVAPPVASTAAASARPTLAPTSAPPGRGPRTASPAAVPAPSTPPAPRPTTTLTRLPVPPPVDPVVALRRTIDAQVDSGQLKAKPAEDLRKRTDDIGRRLDAGDDVGVDRKIRELRTRLGDLRERGELSDPGYAALVRDVDALSASR
ncbi:serine/threonine-protein kinase [Asanoa siamensis]|uniref:non-specific serine/threonine protein kinase n=1 Tax=Asanoa siamensis TaxID=926357 RepID=A0ABQ4CKV5_9ACTN|nr:serine/threonine-protein kinase [Asanoa siamensis]GIF71928.1 hypothetical protein Asi02nite_14460 [Asanoa siamensis]